MAAQKHKDLLDLEQTLKSNDSKVGKARFATWRMDHAKEHDNIQPGAYGRPLFHHDLDRQILDPLHYACLNMGKVIFKHALLNQASDDARQEIAKQLALWKHPLDTRRREDNRNGRQKWFTGERWVTFCAGERGSPGGPIAIATLALVLGKDLRSHGAEADVRQRPTTGRDEADTVRTESIGAAGESAGAKGGRSRRAPARGRHGCGRGRNALCFQPPKCVIS